MNLNNYPTLETVGFLFKFLLEMNWEMA